MQVFDASIQLRVTGFIASLFFFDDAAEFLALERDLLSEFLDVLDFRQLIEAFGGAFQLAVETSGFLGQNSNGFPQNLDDFTNGGFPLEQVEARSIEIFFADFEAFGGVLRKVGSSK